MKELLQRWRSRVLNKTRSFRVGAISTLWAQRYAVAVDDLNPLYFSLDEASKAGHPALLAPPNYITTLRDEQEAGPSESELLVDGTRPDGRPDLPGLIVMGGGQDVTFHAPVYCGEVIVGEKEIVEVSEQQGRSGPMVVIVEEIRYRTEAGEAKVTLRNTALYRIAEGAALG